MLSPATKSSITLPRVEAESHIELLENDTGLLSGCDVTEDEESLPHPTTEIAKSSIAIYLLFNTWLYIL